MLISRVQRDGPKPVHNGNTCQNVTCDEACLNEERRDRSTLSLDTKGMASIYAFDLNDIFKSILKFATATILLVLFA